MSDQPVLRSTLSFVENSFSTLWSSSSHNELHTITNHVDEEFHLHDDESIMKCLSDCPVGRATEKDEKGSSTKSNYRHIPHSVRPAIQVARRNARERRRVQSVNVAFSKLHQIVPTELGEREKDATEKVKGAAYEDARGRRSSKVAILKRAIDYIKLLEEVLFMQNHSTIISYIAEM